MIVLGIETSCDETAAAVIKNGNVLSSELFSQVALHGMYGGVVPEIASRSHLEKISLIIEKALVSASHTFDMIDTVAVTSKPGLPGSLLVGFCFAKMAAWAQNKHFICVDHLEGHIFSPFLEYSVPFPHLCLVASGGHTSLYLVHDFGVFDLLGETLDDAAGEAFDKVAKLIGISYPGGPIVEQLAAQVNFYDFFHYPRNKIQTFEVSFSGLKTAVLYDLVARGAYDMQSKQFLKPHDDELKQQISSSLSVCIADILVTVIARVLKQHSVMAITMVGGVACNKYIRQRLTKLGATHKIPFFAPSPQYCTDNAAMIALVGSYKAQKGEFSGWDADIF